MMAIIHMNTTHEITQILSEKFSPAYLWVQDDSPRHAGHGEAKRHGGGHFNLTIVSDQFSRMSSIERHRLIYRSLNGLMAKSIHAVTIRAMTLAEWKTVSQSGDSDHANP